MKPTKQLILGLREAAQRLREHPEQYNWLRGSDCNCGILAQAILGCESVKLVDMGLYASWTTMSKHGFCKTTGLPIVEVLRQLMAHGLEREDFKQLEYPDRPFTSGPDAKPENVAAYFDQLANQLEERRKNGERP